MNFENELYQSIENDEWKSVKNFSEMKKTLKAAAEDSSIKNKKIDIAMTQRDIEGLKTKALEEGVSYQIFAASILHKYVTGNLVEENKFNLS